RLEAAKAALSELAQQVSVPAENLLSPDAVRRLCWDWAPVGDTEAVVDEFLRECSARPWQRELTVPVLAQVLTTEQPESRPG
ncbi:MAG TPA: ribonuclease D, partial [Mycobacterium sp.]|nr:ribonuclease D [Mycobacterium sp.]